MPPIEPKFKEGLKLIHVTYYEINEKQETGKGWMEVTVKLDVPKSTKFVHLAVIAAKVASGKCNNPTPAPLGQIAYEIIRKDEKLSNDKYTCKFRAHLHTDDAGAEWCGYFVLEVLCFG
jgi:hypothetical protein